jgi:hypothetical protein
VVSIPKLPVDATNFRHVGIDNVMDQRQDNCLDFSMGIMRSERGTTPYFVTSIMSRESKQETTVLLQHGMVKCEAEENDLWMFVDAAKS